MLGSVKIYLGLSASSPSLRRILLTTSRSSRVSPSPFWAPYRLQQLVVRHNPARVECKFKEQLVLRGRQTHWPPCQGNPPFCVVNVQFSHRVRFRRLREIRGTLPQGSPDPWLRAPLGRRALQRSRRLQGRRPWPPHLPVRRQTGRSPAYPHLPGCPFISSIPSYPGNNRSRSTSCGFLSSISRGTASGSPVTIGS